MDVIEIYAREICCAYGGHPDEWVQRHPAGPRMRYWQHFEELAFTVWLWLERHSRS
ncbi:MAG: hypothetical protein JHD15_07195 [Phenylobacterium sp.]|uniref:hypothetical protein n=1 Tax=Phenylobacterium sp. TaxID=1871053 RepID=UPI001A31D8E5|nr:hypothetical protein [Phenylobacterium sp.]MBJ7410139.1 hypothetical protein [Phenylobacterium sp.]